MSNVADEPQIDEDTKIKKPRKPRKDAGDNGTDNRLEVGEVQDTLTELLNFLSTMVKSSANFDPKEFKRQGQVFSKLSNQFPIIKIIFRAALPLVALGGLFRSIKRIFDERKPQSQPHQGIDNGDNSSTEL
jgi:hypothetical protein